MNTSDKSAIVMRDSPEAATYRTDISGWVSRDGRYYGNDRGAEATARWAGCTHVACERCGATTEKSWTKCRGCRDLMERERYDARPKAEWDGEAYLYSEALDRYFPDMEEAEDTLEEGQRLADLMLVICKPNHVPQLEPDYCCDELPDDGEGDVPDAVAEAMDAFNKAVAGIVLSWSPGKFALKLPDGGEAA